MGFCFSDDGNIESGEESGSNLVESQRCEEAQLGKPMQVYIHVYTYTVCGNEPNHRSGYETQRVWTEDGSSSRYAVASLDSRLSAKETRCFSERHGHGATVSVVVTDVQRKNRMVL